MRTGYQTEVDLSPQVYQDKLTEPDIQQLPGYRVHLIRDDPDLLARLLVDMVPHTIHLSVGECSDRWTNSQGGDSLAVRPFA